MGIYTFKIGTRIKVRGTDYEIVNKLVDGRFQLRQPETSELANLSIEEVQSLYAKGELEFVPKGLTAKAEDLQQRLIMQVEQQFALLPEERQAPARRRLCYVKAVLAAGITTLTPVVLEPIIRKCATTKENKDTKLPSSSSVKRWVRRFLKRGKDIRALVDAFELRGNRKPRIDPRVRELAIQALDEVYLRNERSSLKDTRLYLVVLIEKDNAQRPPSQHLDVPSVKYLQDTLKAEYDDYTIKLRRYGKLAADRDFRIVLGNKEPVSRPLQRVELDHTVLDLIVVDEKKLVLLGRPIIVVAIDCHTRCIVGFAIGFRSPSAMTVAQCLKHAILPKNYLKSLYPEVENTWDCLGTMETLVLDRALENLGVRVESACLQLGIDIEYCARKTPWGKGTVERVLRTLLEDLIHVMPGTTFRNVLERGDYQSGKHAVVRLSSLRATIHKWIVDVYHQRLHRGIQDTPAHKWKVDIAAHPFFLPQSVRELEVALGEPAKRVVWHYGIEINNLRYNAMWLGELRRNTGNEQEVELMWYSEEMGHIDVLDPDTKRYRPVPCLDPEYAVGLSLYQHELIREHARRTMQGRQDISALARAKEEIRQSIAESLGRKRGTTHKRMARYAEGRGFDYSQALPEEAPTTDGSGEELSPTTPAVPQPAESDRGQSSPSAGSGKRSGRRQPKTPPPPARDGKNRLEIPEYLVEGALQRANQSDSKTERRI